MRKFMIVGLLLTLYGGLSLSFPRPTMSTAETRSAANSTSAIPSRAVLSLPPQAQPSPATIIRTIVYRQITDFQNGGSVGSIPNMKVSADGSKIVFLSGQKVFTIDATGQNLREVFDAGNPATNSAPSWIDISANGSKVMWAVFQAPEIFVANSDGSNRVRLAPTFQNQFGTEALLQGRLNPRMTADGSRIYFTHIGSTTDIAGGYRINTDGTGLTKLFSYRQMAQLFGLDGSRYAGDCGNCAFNNALAISDDGSRLVFGTASFSSDRNVLAYDSSTGLRKLTDFLAGTNAQGLDISGDGSKVTVLRNFPDRISAVTMNFDGSNQIENSRLTGDGPYLGGMTGSGAQVLANIPGTGSGVLPLINTDGGGRVDLIAAGDCDIDPFPGAPGGGFTASLEASGRRFAFTTRPGGLPHQIWVADINPSSVGDAPAISEVSFNPSFVLANHSTSSTFTARASGGQGGLRRVACGASLKDGAAQFRYVGFSLYDDGSHGDQATNDGLYTNNQVFNDQAPPDPVNPLQMRTNVIANSLRQVTAVDATPFFVLTQAPSGSGPHIDSITPSSGAPGIQVRIIGSGFDPVASNNIVIFGNRQAVVKTASADRTTLDVIVPPDLAPGVVSVTVTVAAQTSNAVNFTVLSDPTCTFSISPASQSFPASGGQGSVNVTASRSNCSWSASSNVAWLTITAGIPGSGNGAVSYSVAANTGQSRTGTLTIAGQTFTVTQEGTACTFSISPTSQSFTASGGNGSVAVTTQTGCVWLATSNAAWITITSGTSGQGNGAVDYSVAANSSTASRTGTLTIAGQTFTVTQSGAPGAGPVIRIEPTTLTFTASSSSSGLALAVQAPAASAAASDSSTQPPAHEREEGEDGETRREFMEWFYRQREYPLRRIPERARERALEEQDAARRRLAAHGLQASSTAWTPITSATTKGRVWGELSGRVTAVAIHPTNPNIVYVSGAQGGVWKTTDNGASWAALTDNQPSLAIGALTLDPSNPNIIYAGTGENNFSSDSYYGNGLLKSSDGGQTWTVLGAATFARLSIGKIIVNPSNGQNIVVASNGGIFRTFDGGASWARVLSGTATDLVVASNAPTTLYASFYTFGVWKSTDGGSNWVRLTGGLPSSGISRAQLAISPASPSTLLAVFANNENKLEGLYRTTDAGANWTKLVNTPEVFGGQGFYDISLAIHPSNTSIIYLGGIQLWRSTDGGTTWASVTNPSGYFSGVHPDHHAIAISAQNPSVVWIGCDGGTWRSDSGGDTWINRNAGLSLTQFYSVALHPTDGSIIFGGTQDNGIQRYGTADGWTERATGDQGSTWIDFNNPATIYTTYIFLNIEKSTNAGESFFGSTNGIPFTNGRADGRAAFIAPFAMDPSNPQKLAGVTHRVWYTADGAANWINISNNLTNDETNVLTTITFASGGARLWVGSSNSLVWRGDSSGGNWTWTNVTKAPLPNYYITRLAAHPSDPQTAYISYSGFGIPHIFKTADGGQTWTNASAGLPDIPVNAVTVDPRAPNTVYAGTDIGIYRSTDGGQNWSPFGTGLPNVAVFDLAVSRTSGVLRAATHGRGIWEIQTGGEQSFTIFNDGQATLRITGISKQNNSSWLSFTTPSAIPFDIAPGSSAPVRVNVNTAGLSAGVYSDRLLVTSNDTPRSPYPTGVFINLTVTGTSAGCTLTPTSIGQTVSGDLTTSDCRSPIKGNQYYADRYSFNASAGQQIALQLTSSEFDTHVYLLGTGGQTLSNDDDGGGGTNSRIPAGNGFFTLPSNGTYIIEVSSSLENKTGKYTLSLTTPAGCAFTVTPTTSQSFGANGGFGGFEVRSLDGCGWTASSNANWIVIVSGGSGSGNDIVNYSVAANTTGSSRSGTLTIAGQTFTITQAGGSACTFALDATSRNVAVGGEAFAVQVTTQSSCTWNATSNVPWITVPFNSLTGSGAISVVVAPNNGGPRTGTLLIAGQTFTVTQAGNGNCTYALTPSSQPFTASGGNGAVGVNAPNGCAWTAASNAAWITIFPGSESGSGNGGVAFTVSANTGSSRTGTMTIAGQTFTVTQTGATCTFSITPTNQSFAANGGTGSVTVTTQSNCNWTATSNAAWIVITSGISGSSSGTVAFTVAANTASSGRTGTLTIAGQTFVVTQSGGSTCTFTIAPSSQSFTASGGTNSVTVTTSNGCSWTSVSNALWITITSGVSGSSSGAVNYSVAANTSNASRTGTMTIAGQTFTVTQSGATSGMRLVRVVDASGTPGSAVGVPVELIAQGDENAVGFSLTFDPAILSNPQAVAGSGAVGASLHFNPTQAAQGRVGIVLSLPTGQSFAAGTRQLVIVTFSLAAGTTATSTVIGFGDQPVTRETVNIAASALATLYTPGTVTLAAGYEGDVAPRPSGNSTVTIADWVQIGLFAAGLATPANSSEFQRADCAPRETTGNGVISLADWVQAGRYAAGVDPLTPAGGPSSASFTGLNPVANSPAAASDRVMRITNANLERGAQGTIALELDAQGNENALGFSLTFDQAQLNFISAAVGSGANGASLNVNSIQAASGRLGLALALPAGQTLSAGTRQLVVLTFAVSATGNSAPTTFSFGDQPIAREVVDANAGSLTTNYTPSAVTITRTAVTVSAASFGQALAGEAIVSAFGASLATGTQSATTVPLPTSLAGTTVKVRDSAGTSRLAPLFFVSANQINYQIPPGTVTGTATVTVTTGDGITSIGTVQIDSVAPALFTFTSDGQGIPAAIVRRFRNNQELFPSVLAAQLDAQNKWVAIPIDLGPDTDLVVLEMYGTGLRLHNNTASSVTVKIGGADGLLIYAGLTPGLVGLDQVDFFIPRSLIGRGDVDIVLTVDGKTANTVKVNIK